MHLSLEHVTDQMQHVIEQCRLIQIRGRVTQVTGTLLKAVVPGVRIGELCHLRNPDHSLSLMAEVIGFQQHQALLAIKGYPGRDRVTVGELAGRLLIYDALAAETRTVKIGADPECPVCGAHRGET